MTARVNNRGMRRPSPQRAPASRRAVLRTALTGAIALVTLVPAGAASARGLGDVVVAKGVGRQVFAGGSGVVYGTLFSGASLVVTDYSATHDLRVDAPVLPTTNVDGSRSYVPAGGTQRTAYRISGSVYRLVMTGSTTFNASGVFGRLQLRGKGTLTLNGHKSRWGETFAIRVSDPPRGIRPLFRLAVTGAPPPASTEPPPTTTSTTTLATVPSSG